MKKSYFYKVSLFFALMIMSFSFTATAHESDPPEGWDIMYFNMGSAEYCSTTFAGGSDELQFDMYTDGISISIRCGNTNPKSCNLTIGTLKLSCKSSEYGELIIELRDKKIIDTLVKEITEKGLTAELEYGGQTKSINVNNQATKNIIAAMQWVRSSPCGMEM